MFVESFLRNRACCDGHRVRQHHSSGGAGKIRHVAASAYGATVNWVLDRRDCPRCGHLSVVKWGILPSPPGAPVLESAALCRACWAKTGRLDRRTSIRACKAARTVAGLCALTARWLEGAMSECPSGGDGAPDPETLEIAVWLARINRGGLLTCNSQPSFDGPGWQGVHVMQRAYVSLYCPNGRSEALRQAAQAEGLIVLEEGDRQVEISTGYPPRADRPSWLPARFVDWVEANHTPVRPFEPTYASPAAMRELDSWTFFEIVDPEWEGLGSPLWRVLLGFVQPAGKGAL
ncbi:DUF6919 domain-containing protein [Actinomadura sp. 3N407]|uniref:DUF6919 domain-containing protein n=1 Tax=Actinomadura sp. 3N407 TaxID=3457423 RepID=UPI003FCD56A5